MKEMNLEIHIERLVLDGVSVQPGQGDRLRRTMVAELGRLLRQGALDPQLVTGGIRPYLSGSPLPSVETGPASNTAHRPTEGRAEDLGHRIAHAVYGGLGADTHG